MTDAPDELEQAVSYLKGELADADRHKWLTATVDADDLRLLLSERAELLATVERMRHELVTARMHIETIPGGFDDRAIRIVQNIRAVLTGEEK